MTVSFEDLPDLESTLNRIVEQPDIPVKYRFRKINKIGGTTG
jgi:hypothetical protein